MQITVWCQQIYIYVNAVTKLQTMKSYSPLLKWSNHISKIVELEKLLVYLS